MCVKASHSSGYRYSRTDTVEAMTALGRQPKVEKCVCVYKCAVGGGGGGGGGELQSAEAEIGQMVTVRFKGFACPLLLLSLSLSSLCMD